MLQLFRPLRLPLLLFLLLLLVAELVVGEDAGNGRVRGRDDLDEVEPRVGRAFQRFPEGENAEVLAVRVNDPEFPRGYLIIDSVADADMV